MSIWTKIKGFFTSEKNVPSYGQYSGGLYSNPYFGLDTFLQNLFGRFSGTNIDYQREAGELTQSRLIMAAVNFLGRTLPEAVLEVSRPKADGTSKVIAGHPLVKLFKRPNRFYAGSLLWKSIGLSWIIAGNVYLYKVRNKAGEVIELWYLPHTLVEPRWESENSFIDYYAYQVEGKEFHLKIEDVIHLRNGIDPHNTRLGLSDIASALREIFTDNEISNFSALLIKNSGVGPFVISPKQDKVNLSKDDRQIIADAYQRNMSGDNRGKPVVNSVAIEIQKTGFNPEELDLAKLRLVPEQTISSLTGIPAIVLQFGAGLERSTYSNYSEAREAAYESVIVPLWKYLAEEITAQLLIDFDQTGKLEAGFNMANVRVLQEDENKLYIRVGVAYQNGVMKRSESRSRIGLPTDEADDVYFVEPKMPDKKEEEEEVVKKV